MAWTLLGDMHIPWAYPGVSSVEPSTDAVSYLGRSLDSALKSFRTSTLATHQRVWALTGRPDAAGCSSAACCCAAWVLTTSWLPASEQHLGAVLLREKLIRHCLIFKVTFATTTKAAPARLQAVPGVRSSLKSCSSSGTSHGQLAQSSRGSTQLCNREMYSSPCIALSRSWGNAAQVLCVLPAERTNQARLL